MKQNCTHFYSILPLRFLTIALLLLTGSLISGCDLIKSQLAGESGRYEMEGDQLFSQGRVNEAILAYRHALTIDPDRPQSSIILAQLYRDQGRLRLGKLVAQASLDFNPKNQELKKFIDEYPPTQLQNTLFPLQWIVFPSVFAEPDINRQPSPAGFTITDDHLIVAYREGIIAKINSASGITIWQKNINEEISAPPTVTEVNLTIGATSGKIILLDEKDGSQKWQFQTGGAVFAGCAFDSSTIYCGSDDQYLYAIQVADGSLRWKYKTQGYLHSQPVISGKSIIFGSGDTHIYNLNIEDGSRMWETFPLTQGGIESSPLIAGGVIYVGSNDSRIYALSENSGAELWQYSTPDSVFTTPQIQGDIVYVASTGQLIAALNRDSGEEIWQTNPSASINFNFGIHQNLLFYTQAADPNIYVLNKNTGEEVNKIDTGDWIAANPLFTADRMYILGKDGAVLSFKIGK